MSSINSREAIFRYPLFNPKPAAFRSFSISWARAENSGPERTLPWPMLSTMSVSFVYPNLVSIVVFLFCFSFSIILQILSFIPLFQRLKNTPSICTQVLSNAFPRSINLIYVDWLFNVLFWIIAFRVTGQFGQLQLCVLLPLLGLLWVVNFYLYQYLLSLILATICLQFLAAIWYLFMIEDIFE